MTLLQLLDFCIICLYGMKKFQQADSTMQWHELPGISFGDLQLSMLLVILSGTCPHSSVKHRQDGNQRYLTAHPQLG
jgi:hypothetical protein